MNKAVDVFERQIPKHEEAAMGSRRWVEALDLPLSAERHDDLVFLTNELVTNAMVHANGAEVISVAIEVLPKAVRVTVTDDGEGDILDFSEPDLMDTSGRGLMLVRMIASRCGAWQLQGSSVWFEIDQ